MVVSQAGGIFISCISVKIVGQPNFLVSLHSIHRSHTDPVENSLCQSASNFFIHARYLYLSHFLQHSRFTESVKFVLDLQRLAFKYQS